MGGMGNKEEDMYNYQYVTKKQAAPIKNTLLEIIHEVQDQLRDDFTFQYEFIGSSSHNMITRDVDSNIGFDFDINLKVNDEEENFSAEQIKKKLMAAFNKVIRNYGYNYCEDSTRVITIKFVDRQHSRIAHSCDFAIVNDCTDDNGERRQQYIRFNKSQNSYSWEYQPHPYHVEEKADWIKKNGFWDDVLDIYLDKKKNNLNHVKHSRSLYAETIHEVCQKHGYYKN